MGTKEECKFRLKGTHRKHIYKLQHTADKEAPQSSHIVKSQGIEEVSDFSTVTLEAKRQWCNISKILKKKKVFQTKHLCQSKLSMKCKENTFRLGNVYFKKIEGIPFLGSY